VALDQLGFALRYVGKNYVEHLAVPGLQTDAMGWWGSGHTGWARRALCSPSHVAIATLAHFAPAGSTASTLGLNAINSDKRAAVYKPTARM